MNPNTRKDLQDFITAVENLAHAVSSVAETKALVEIFYTAEKLKVQLDKDETIL